MDPEVLRWLDVESLFRVKVKVSLFVLNQLYLTITLIIEQKPSAVKPAWLLRSLAQEFRLSRSRNQAGVKAAI
jgi:hypothetical protein